MNTRYIILQKKNEIKELNQQFLKENVGNTFFLSEYGKNSYYIQDPFDGSKYNEIPVRYIHVYEENGEILTKHILVRHISKSDPTKYTSGGYADWRHDVYETMYDKVISGIRNFDYLDKIIEENSIVNPLPEEIEYLLKNVQNYNTHGEGAFIVNDNSTLEERLERIKHFTNKCT